MIAAMMKNECSVFTEWVRHHFDEGFSHFYLVDNGSAQHKHCSAEIKRSVESLKKELSAALHIWVRPFQSRYLQLLVFDQLMPRFVRDELGVERTSGHSAAAARRSVAGVNASVYSIPSAGGTGGRLRVGNDLGDRDELQKVSDTAGSDLWVMPIDLDEFVYSAKENTTFAGEISRMIDADARAFDAAANVTDDFDRLAALGVPTENPVGEALNTTAPWHLGRAAAAGLNSVVPPSYSRKRMLSQVCFPWVQFGTPGNMTLHPLEGKLRMAMTRRTKFSPENDTRVADFPYPDGEILLPLYRKLGPLFAQELEGEFAIAIYDFAKRQVVLSRDTFGTKPLYYWRQKRPSPSTPGFHVASYRSTLCRLKAAAARTSGSGAGAGDESNGEEGENLSVDQIEQTCSDRGFDDGDDVKRFPPNTVAVFPLVDEHEDEQDDLGAGVRGQYTRIWTRSLYEFDARQFKNHTRDWHAAFDRSMHMRLRFTQHPLFIALSSGFDSGLLHAAYVANAVGSAAAHREDSLSARRLRPLAFRRSPRGKQILHTFSIRGKEELNTLRGRVRYSKKLGEIIDRRLAERSRGDEISETSTRIVDGGRHEKAVLFHFGTQTAAEQISKLKTYCEPYRFRWHGYPQDGPYTQGAFIWADQATHGLSVVYSAARRHGARIALSGTGGDEHVAGDYSRFGPDSYSEVPELPSEAEVEEWETKYNSISAAASPEAKTLAVEFPWGGFFLDRLQDYIMKEEVVAGAYGIETRFPFLDRRLVQEFLWLSADVKNSKYKRPIVDYLLRNWYPFVGGRKMGFGVRPWDKKEFEKGNRHWVEDMAAGAGGGAGG
eukprot:g14518.t1